MDETISVKTFKYSSTHQPMFSVVETPLQYKSFSQNNAVFQDFSFSSYLKPKDLTPTQNSPKEDTVDDTEISIFDARKYFSESNDTKDINKQQQHQEPSHDLLSVPRPSSVSSVDGYGKNFQTRSFHSTPTASSEASWNSQTGLLANPPGSTGVFLRNFPSDQGKKGNSVAKRWIFGRKCCCTGKKSVQVKGIATSDSEHRGPVTNANNNDDKSRYLCAKREHSQKEKSPPPPPSVISQGSSIPNNIIQIHPPKALVQKPLRLSPDNHDYAPPSDSPHRHQRVSVMGRKFPDGVVGFSFPVLNSSSQKEVMNKKTIIGPLEDPPRDSLDVFQPINELQPAITRPPGPDNAVRLHFSPGSPIARVANTCAGEDDVGSDASSDLFEIESFSTQTGPYPMYRRRDSLDESPAFNARKFGLVNVNDVPYGRRSLEEEPPTPSLAGTECYPPSEVSVDWSVATAEGFERASISASEMGSAGFFRPPTLRVEEEMAGKMRKGGNGGGLLLMGCRQEKAVSVGPQPVKCVAAAEGLPLAFPVHVGSRPPRGGKPQLGSSHSARLSLAFAA